MELYDVIRLFINTVHNTDKDYCCDEDVMRHFYGKMEAYAEVFESILDRTKFID